MNNLCLVIVCQHISARQKHRFVTKMLLRSSQRNQRKRIGSNLTYTTSQHC